MTTANLKNEKFFLSLIYKNKIKVTKSGRAFNLKTEKEIAVRRKENVYRKISWLDKQTGKIIQIQLHRLIWAFFKGVTQDASLVINHKDTNKANCSLSNLELDTFKHNNRHARTAGLIKDPRGEERQNAVFTDAQVIKLRKQVKIGRANARQIADNFSCDICTVQYMLKKKTYNHI